jgi:hypothetical protein
MYPEPTTDRAYANAKAVPVESFEDAYLSLRAAAEEAAQAGAGFLASRARWQAAQAGLAEANERVKRAHDANSV